MLVVISDLHFEEEKSNYVGKEGDKKSIRFSRNLSKKAFQIVISRLAGDVERSESKIEKLDLVFAGDIFDLHRTGLWFDQKCPDQVQPNQNNSGADDAKDSKLLRPYYNNWEVTNVDGLEDKLIEIFEAVQGAEGVQGALEVFRLLAEGKYMDGDVEREFPVKDIKFHYIPGNHDRLVNATPKLRCCVRQALGMPSCGKPFDNILKFEEYRTLVRHGQEYDPGNFSADYRKEKIFPPDIKAEVYGAAPFGDFVTVDIASRLPCVFRDIYEKEQILNNSILEALYRRLLEFDDVRPQRALFNYLFNMPLPSGCPEIDWERNGSKVIWKKIKPVLVRLL